MRVGRLRRLEQMGLVEEKRTGVWAMDPQLETKLRSLGERGDIMVIMNQVMRAHGIDRPAGDFAIFSGARKSDPVIGRIVEVGIVDEMSDRKYLIVRVLTPLEMVWIHADTASLVRCLITVFDD